MRGDAEPFVLEVMVNWTSQQIELERILFSMASVINNDNVGRADQRGMLNTNNIRWHLAGVGGDILLFEFYS